METFKLFTSIRYDQNIRKVYGNPAFEHAGWNYQNSSACYMLDYHRDRILRAAKYWHWTGAVDAISGTDGLRRIESRIEEYLGPEKGASRLRILVNEIGELQFERSDEAERSLESLFPAGLPPPPANGSGPVFTVVLDSAETAKSAYTHYKTTKREMYNDARKRAGIGLGDPKEVLLVNDADGAVMEGSITTPYFWRGGRWVTPPVPARFATEEEGSGGQDGTTRRWCLGNGFVAEDVVFASGLVDGECMWLSNGAKGFMPGVIQRLAA